MLRFIFLEGKGCFYYIHFCSIRQFSPFLYIFVVGIVAPRPSGPSLLIGQVDLRNKEDNKEVSLSTSKINYMDPRVSVAWCKRHEVPVEKASSQPVFVDPFLFTMLTTPGVVQ